MIFGIVVDPGRRWRDLQYGGANARALPLLCHHPIAATKERSPYCSRARGRGSVAGVTRQAADHAPIDAALARSGLFRRILCGKINGHPATVPVVAAGIGINILPALALPLPELSPLW